MTKSRVLWFLLALVLAAGLFTLLRPPEMPLPPVATVTIAVPMQINSATMLVASAQGLFERAGVKVTIQPFELGKDALQSVRDGHADLALVADTPLMFALQAGADIGILAGVSQGRRTMAVIARKDRGIQRLEDLKGRSVGLSLGTNLTYFLDAMLQVHGISSSTVRLVDLSTAQVVHALMTGKIDAAVLYQPFLSQVVAQMKDQTTVFYGEDIYSARFFLTGKNPYIASHPQEIQRVLQGLLAAQDFIQSDPVRARGLVASAVRMEDQTLASMFDPEDYKLSLNQAMLLTLDDQTRWAMKRGLVTPGPMPNYLHATRYQHLEMVSPSAVTLVR